MNTEQSHTPNADLLRTAIKERDGQAFTRHLNTLTTAVKPMYAPDDNLQLVLYALAQEDPTRDTLTFIRSYVWSQDLLHDFAVRDIYSYLTNDSFRPTIVECLRDNNYSIQKSFDDTWIDTDALIPERLQSFFDQFGTVLDEEAQDKLIERVKDYHRLDRLEVPLLEWALTYHEATLTSDASTTYFNLLGYVHEQDRQKAFEVLSRSKCKFKAKQYRRANQELIDWLKLRDLNNKLSSKYQEKHKKPVSKI